MRRIAALAAGSVFVVLLSDVAQAASITNRDDRDHKVTLIATGEKPRDQILKSNAVLADICPKGCIVRLNDRKDDEYELEGPEVVSIEDGALYYDGPEAPTEPAPETGRVDGRKR